jgi:hypothetical protein
MALRFIAGHLERADASFRLQGSSPFPDIIECLPLAYK